ncbi:MAG TPA: PRC-barrel domain-containing protein [Rhizomicrobium sp.]|nr:PRC-barrel domain-containing protein [Rhizomicrobium sp.]
MKFKSIALASCAAIALGAMGTPALAAHRHHHHHHHHYSSTSKEDAQEAKTTRELNEQQTQNPGSTPSNKSSENESGQNQNQMAENNDQNANNNSSAVGRAAAETGAEIDKAAGVKRPVTNAEMRQAVSASQVADPAKTLATAEVKTQRGEAVGEVKAIEVNPDGTAKTIKADVGGFLGMGEREVNIDASNLRYIKDRNILVTDMSKPQIQNLPPVNANENNNNQNNKNTTY